MTNRNDNPYANNLNAAYDALRNYRPEPGQPLPKVETADSIADRPKRTNG